ncbi:MAG: hypothetical protein ACM3S1_06310 [Hyphomicrobiales bacterium]
MTTAGESQPEGQRPRVDELLLDELTEQLDRTRRLLTGNPEAAAEAALARMGGQREAEMRIAADLAVMAPLAQPERFAEAHRLTMRALEVLDREGSRDPGTPRLGPLSPVLAVGIEFVAEYIVKSYAESIAQRLRTLYARREAQCPPGAPERRLLASARVEMDRLAPTFSGGGTLAPILFVGGALVPLLASFTNLIGAIDFGNRAVVWVGLAVLFVLFLALSTVMLRGAAVAHRRSTLIMQRPLAALWETIGHAGNPPENDSTLFATVAIVLTAVVWFVIPAVAGLVLVID